MNKGVLSAVLAYIMWGILPIYWKALANVSSEEILVSRVIWSFVFTFILVLLIGKRKHLIRDFKDLWKNKKAFFALFSAAFLVTGNWFIYIWAVNHNYLVQTSLGYYMNPLLSVLLGVLFLKEKLGGVEKIAFMLAAIGVIKLTLFYGSLPWIALSLAASFALYGLFKKQVQLDALRGLTIETLFVLPIALIFYLSLFSKHEAMLGTAGLKTTILLVGTGIITAIPLVLFAKGAQQIPLYMVGFLQYINPTIMLFLGVVIYREQFTMSELLSFAFIWMALLLFTVPKIWQAMQKNKIKKSADVSS